MLPSVRMRAEGVRVREGVTTLYLLGVKEWAESCGRATMD